jgi:hypothetical protein
MAVLSVDLATRRWSDLGIVILDRTPAVHSPNCGETRPGLPLKPSFTTLSTPPPAESLITCEILPWNDPGPVEADALAGRLNHLCAVRGIRILILDGPQAWKSRLNGLKHARLSEQQLNTVAKKGLPGIINPRTCRPFTEFCLDLYAALCRRGWQRLQTSEHPSSAPQRELVESCPHAAWKSLGLRPLPAKRRARVSDLAEAFGARASSSCPCR